MDDNAYRAVSKGLFGNRHKLEVLCEIANAIADGEQDVYPRMISRKVINAADNQVGDVFNQLHRGGLLIPVADKADAQKHRYRARESAIWEMLRDFSTELRAAPWDPEDLVP